MYLRKKQSSWRDATGPQMYKCIGLSPQSWQTLAPPLHLKLVVCVSTSGRNLKEWLQEQFCDKPLEQDDMRLHNAAYVGDLDTLRNLLQEDSFRRWEEIHSLLYYFNFSLWLQSYPG